MLALAIFVTLLASSVGYECTSVNGVEGACDLKLYQITLAGSRQSGAGAYGTQYYWSGLPALACGFQVQDKSITEQLQMGIRYFDFDVSHIHKSSEKLPYWEAGIVITSCGGAACAYSRSLRMALVEIRDFMNANRDEIVEIRIKKYTPETREMKETIILALNHLWVDVFGQRDKETGVKPTFFSTLKPMSYLIENNERIVLKLKQDLWGYESQDFRFHPLVEMESQTNLAGSFNCKHENQIIEYLLNYEKINFREIPVVVNWWLASGSPCMSDRASLCMSDVAGIETIWNEILFGTHLRRPINVVLADYVRPALAEEVKKLNKAAVEFYKENPW